MSHDAARQPPSAGGCAWNFGAGVPSLADWSGGDVPPWLSTRKRAPAGDTAPQPEGYPAILYLLRIDRFIV